MLDRDRGEDSVHDERAGSLSVAHKTGQDVPMPLAGLKNPDGRLRSKFASARITGEAGLPPAR
jgi:hypothetical protein